MVPQPQRWKLGVYCPEPLQSGVLHTKVTSGLRHQPMSLNPYHSTWPVCRSLTSLLSSFSTGEMQPHGWPLPANSDTKNQLPKQGGTSGDVTAGWSDEDTAPDLATLDPGYMCLPQAQS